jgi:hypothetical protein
MSCIKGYRLFCSNSRIENEIDGLVTTITERDPMTKTMCNESKTIDGIQYTVGSCKINEVDIKTNKITANSEQTLQCDGVNPVINKCTAILSGQAWTASENIINSMCGICVPKDKLQSNEGINYISTSISNIALPNTIINGEDCNNYIDPTNSKSKPYKFITNYFVVEWESKYTSNKTNIWNAIINPFFALYNNNSAVYNPNLFSGNDQKIKEIWQIISYRKTSQCEILVRSLYGEYLSNIGKNGDPNHIAIRNDVDNVLTTGTTIKDVCTNLLTMVETAFSTKYNNFVFNSNI